MEKLAPKVPGQLAIDIPPKGTLSVTRLNSSYLCYVLYMSKMGLPLRLPFFLARQVEMLCTQSRGINSGSCEDRHERRAELSNSSPAACRRASAIPPGQGAAESLGLEVEICP